MQNNTDDELDFLSPVIKMWDEHAGRGIDESVRAWRMTLQGFPANKPMATSKESSRWFLLSKDTKKVKKQVRQWFETKPLSNSETKRLHRLFLFSITPSGIVRLNKPIMPTSTASALLTVVGLLAGIWIGWILFGARPSIVLIIQSVSVGMILGSLTGVILDLSYRHKHMYYKLLEMAPWLVDGDRGTETDIDKLLRKR